MALKREIQVNRCTIQTHRTLATLLYAFFENNDFNVITNVTKDVLK